MVTRGRDSGQESQTHDSRHLDEQCAQLVIKLEQELAELRGTASGDAMALVEECEIILAEIGSDLANSKTSLGKSSG